MPPRKKAPDDSKKKATAKVPKGAPKGPRGMGKPIPSGVVMVDLVKKQWQLGPVIGQGGFGYIYLGGDSSASTITEKNATYVIKVEPHANGPLFVELAFYQRVAKSEMISTWLKEKKRKHVGIPLYIATGSFENGGEKYRFMVMDRFGTDIEKIYKENEFQFPEETVYSLGLRVLDALEYMHSKEYVHADIKSSNIMLGYTKLSQKKAYLLDYGLAYRYKPASKHVPYKEDPKRRHDGTIEYTSRDAHRGCAPSRRGDLEILGYCMLQWLCKKLPWERKLDDKEYVMNEKIKYMKDISSLMKECFSNGNIPGQLKDYLEYVTKLTYDEDPDYEKVRNLFKTGLKKAGHTDDGSSIVFPSSTQTKKRSSSGGLAGSSPKKRAKKDVQSSKNEITPSPPKITSGAAKSSKTVNGVARKSPVKKTTASKTANITTTNGRSKQVSSTVPTVVMTNESVNETRVVHRRSRRKKVPTRDFGQSP